MQAVLMRPPPDRASACLGWVHRCGALVVLGLWVTAQFLPYTTTTQGGSGGVNRDYGYHLALWGWLGPLELNIAWYANIPLLVTVARILLGKRPHPRVTLVTTLIALDALVPAAWFDFEVSGQFRAIFLSGPAVWVWLGAFAVNAILGWSAAAQALRS